jgi:MerR family transcriptional regulator, light-induced transcriptional regulator
VPVEKRQNSGQTLESRGFRIGELSRRSGASPDVLRSWERRYELLQPTRTAAGYRLYSELDQARALEMQARIARGVAAAEAAEQAKAAVDAARAPSESVGGAALLGRLNGALDAYDGAEAERVFDRALLNFGLAQTIQLVVIPCLRDVGRRWECGEISVADEHFATGVIRGCLVRLAAGWGEDGSRVALLACAPGELHDVGLLAFGLALHSYYGWRITYLGADVPVSDLAGVAAATTPDLVVASAVTAARFFPDLEGWRALGGRTTLAIGGAGAGTRLARQMGAAFLSGDPVVAASRAAAGL